MTCDGIQITENGKRKTENRKQKTENRKQKTENGKTDNRKRSTLFRDVQENRLQFTASLIY
ncbi:hypothetical protein DMZ48_10100 [Robertkochia solimangrovi]|nr:hypothetical protein DMZ48_10100 [Robertkochia solimangrovi]